MHKRQYSDGFYVDFFNTKKKNSNPELVFAQKSNAKLKTETGPNYSTPCKMEKNNEIDKNTYANDIKIFHKLKSTSLNNSTPTIKNIAKKAKYFIKIKVPFKAQSQKNKNTGPFFGFMHERSSNFGPILGAIVGLILSILFLIFIFILLDSLVINFIFFSYLLLILTLIVALTIGILLIFNTD